MADEMNVIVQHKNDPLERYGIPADRFDKAERGEKSLKAQGFEIVSYIDGSPYKPTKADAEGLRLDAKTERQQQREAAVAEIATAQLSAHAEAVAEPAPPASAPAGGGA